MLRVIAQLMVMLLVPLRADMLSSFIVTPETVVPVIQRLITRCVFDAYIYVRYLVQ